MAIDAAWISAIRAWAARIPEIARVYIFGSYARGEERPDSDLDIGVIVDAGRGDDHDYVVWMFNKRLWLRRLKRRIAMKIDFELGNPEISKHIVAPAIAADGVLVYSREEVVG